MPNTFGISRVTDDALEEYSDQRVVVNQAMFPPFCPPALGAEYDKADLAVARAGLVEFGRNYILQNSLSKSRIAANNIAKFYCGNT